ncbi:sec-independent protein translocase protein TATC, chloroplastic isoform X2 [Phoenix dactylifera]|uniref:Sec-independent protein translocase protein TATC, chloroplastic isoform X2 n=1 Tax=Phoenix dactylifera TaxID=42345 RepID=A0A8B7BXY3_PHODC|nr:sec-independent protein translocase protein TATC, chloroplastic isoform X2 [Phoenix dactylifera]
MGSASLLSHPQLSSCFRRLDPAGQHRYAAPRIKAAPFRSSPRRHRRLLRSALEDDGREGRQQEQQQQPSLGGVGAAVEERPENFQEDSAESIKQDNGQSPVYSFLYPSKELLPDDKEMSISDHLEELRQRIFVSVLAIGAAILGCFAFSKDLILLLEAPVSAQGVRFLQLSPGEFFFTTLKVSGYCGLLLGSPVILYEIIAFVLPGLTRDERRFLGPIVLGSSVLFYAGIAFSYSILTPAALNFFVNYAEGAVESLWSIDQYFEFVLVLMFSTGLSFQVPVIQLLLGQVGLVSGDQMLSIWRYVVVGAVVAAAVLTPSTDPLTQILLAGPLLGLYLGGAWMVKLIGR